MSYKKLFPLTWESMKDIIEFLPPNKYGERDYDKIDNAEKITLYKVLFEEMLSHNELDYLDNDVINMGFLLLLQDNPDTAAVRSKIYACIDKTLRNIFQDAQEAFRQKQINDDEHYITDYEFERDFFNRNEAVAINRGF